jgi:hypothetical protein
MAEKKEVIIKAVLDPSNKLLKKNVIGSRRTKQKD